MGCRVVLVLSILFCLVGKSFSNSYNIKGKVVDAIGEQPIVGATVHLEGLKRIVYTNDKGEFLLENLTNGIYKFLIFQYGYQEVKKSVEIKGKNVEWEVKLKSLSKEMQEFVVAETQTSTTGMVHLKSIEGTSIYAGKKNEVVVLADMDVNMATNNSRQIYAKVAGLNIWENDAAGLQLGIGGRGLSPNRTSNFNTRQNGTDISADALGYPESYYTPPSEAIERIEIVRGAASLQYGTQFGGMLNFKMKQGSKKSLEFITRQTVGSFGLLNTFNSIGGTNGKWNYYGFYQHKRGDGWRTNSEFKQHNAYLHVNYKLSETIKIGAQYTFMTYLAHQAGGLTDQQFKENPRQSLRERNWFNVNWNHLALNLDYKLGALTDLNVRGFGLVANRRALGYMGRVDRPDPMEERNLIWGDFKNWGTEARIVHRWYIGEKLVGSLLGARYYQGYNSSKQAQANSGSNPDFYFLEPDSLGHSAYEFPSNNLALFTEQVFYLTPNFSITPGLRFEYIDTKANGKYKQGFYDLAGNPIEIRTLEEQNTNTRSFLLAGLGVSWKLNEHLEWYANASQNYRSITFSDLRIVNPSFIIDENIHDERGYNTDMGWRGNYKNIVNYDLSVFYLKYNDRIGSYFTEYEDPNSGTKRAVRMRSNISDAHNVGVESFAEVDFIRLIKGDSAKMKLSLFGNFSYIYARYTDADQKAFYNKKVELVPDFTLKSGITYKYGKFSATAQISYTADQFSDATNTMSTPTAIDGLVPAYYVGDFGLGFAHQMFRLACGVNNVTDNHYFTRRAAGYPGPGIIPAEGRNWYCTLQYKLGVQ